MDGWKMKLAEDFSGMKFKKKKKKNKTIGCKLDRFRPC